MGMVFKVIKELPQVKEHRRKFGYRRSQDPAAEAESWKQFFQAIQSGAGIVSDSVWDDVTRLEGDFNLASPPLKKKFNEP